MPLRLSVDGLVLDLVDFKRRRVNGVVESHAKGIEKAESPEQPRDGELLAESCSHTDFPVNSDKNPDVVVKDRYRRVRANAAQRIFDAIPQIQSQRFEKFSVKQARARS